MKAKFLILTLADGTQRGFHVDRIDEFWMDEGGTPTIQLTDESVIELCSDTYTSLHHVKHALEWGQ